jgi:DNA-binding SARP family transcriptional activator
MQRAALALLALNAGKVVSTDRLVEELWGDCAPANPMNSVQSHISQLRRLLGSDRIVTRSPGYLFDLDPDDVDALRFERLVKAARVGPAEKLADALREALALWRGPALADVGDAAFITVEASKLDELRLAALEDRVDADLALGLHAGLVVELQTLTTEHPLRERLHGQLMIALYRSGRQADALRAYDNARKILSEELGLNPGPDLRNLEAAILAQDSALGAAVRTSDLVAGRQTVSLGALRCPLPISYGADEACVGRDADLSRLNERWKHAQSGNQHAIFIAGEPGIGKTRLTVEFARLAAIDGAVVLFGRCDEDVLSPFQPFVEAVSDLVARLDDAQLAALIDTAGPHLARLVPGLALRIGQPATPQPDEPSMLWFVDALASLLAALADKAPLVLVLDDVHWADSTTVAGLRHALRRNSTSRTFILATYRDGGLNDSHPLVELLADLRTDRSCERIALGGLTDVAIAEMLGDSVPDSELRSRAASQLRRETEGNPLFIGELLRQFAGDAETPMSERLLTLGSDAVPEGISEVIARRLHRLSDPSRTLLRLAAILGVSFSTPVVRAFAASSVDDVLAALDEAEEAGIIREDPDSEPPGYVFTHTLVRRTLYDGTSRARRQELHAGAADAITATIGRDENSLLSLARHYRLAGTAVDPADAADVLLDAAALASRGWAKAEAAELYGAALDLLPESMMDRRRFAAMQRSVNLQAAWHARFDHQSIEAVTGALPEGVQDA